MEYGIINGRLEILGTVKGTNGLNEIWGIVEDER